MVKSDLSLHQLLCPLAAISCTSAVTCNLEWGHLWLVSLATERGKINGFSDFSIWLSFSFIHTHRRFSLSAGLLRVSAMHTVIWAEIVECTRLRTAMETARCGIQFTCSSAHCLIGHWKLWVKIVERKLNIPPKIMRRWESWFIHVPIGLKLTTVAAQGKMRTSNHNELLTIPVLQILLS